MERVDRFRPRVARCSTSPTTTSTATRASTTTRAPRATRSARPPTTGPSSPPATRRALARRGGEGAHRDVRTRRHRRRHADAVVDRRTGERFARAEMALTGGHNALNVAAAIACVAPFGVDAPTIRRVLREFRGPAAPDGARRRGARRALLRRLEGHQRRRGGDRARRAARAHGRAHRRRPRQGRQLRAARGRSGTQGPRGGPHRRGRRRHRAGHRRPRPRATRRHDGRSGALARGARRARATPCSSRRPARASTCSATTSTAATSSSAPSTLDAAHRGEDGAR